MENSSRGLYGKSKCRNPGRGIEHTEKCMKISGFMHGITHPELIKRLYEKIPRSMDEMYRVTTSFLQEEVAAFNHSRKKAPASWRQPKEGNKPNFPKKGFKNKKRSDSKHIELKQKQQAKGTKEGGNGRKRQAPSHLDDSTMGEVNQMKGHPVFSSETIISFPSLGEEDRSKGLKIIKAEIEAPARNKKPNDPSYHITHRIQWRNHLANRPDIRTSKDRLEKVVIMGGLSADTLLSASWTHTKGTTKSKWQRRMKKRQHSSRAKGYSVTQKILLGPNECHGQPINALAGRSTTPHGKTGVALTQRSRRSKRYFQTHTFICNHKISQKQLLSNSEITGRMLKWKFELEGYDIQYRPRISIKGQILADFIVERPEEESPDELMTEPEELPEPWTLFTDGSSCIDGSGAGLILTNPEGVEFTYAMRFRFEATNNEAEYEALIAGLRIAEQMGVKNLQANVDSRLVANQVNGSYVAKESGMVQYLEKVKTLTSNFKEFSIKQVPRSENKKADALSKIASTSFAHLSKQVLVEELNEKSINEKEVLAIVEEEGHTWMTPICEYLTKEILPKDKKKARAVRRKASRYAVINETLYKKSFLEPWLRSVVAKAIRTGYYWPTMHTDMQKLIRECNDCQVHCPILRNLQQNLTPITSPWPFYKRGIDIAGPFPKSPGKVMFLIVAIDYFTKWIKAKPVVTITGNQVKKFVWDNIVCRFGLPREIVSDNGKQFCDNPFKD
ncbi:reverse transcriptase domain-containing protein [Tanacetum coccineum]